MTHARPMAPRLPPQAQTVATDLSHPAAPPFTVTVKPANYAIVEIDDRVFVLPRLHRRLHIPGVSGVVRRRGPDGLQYADAQAAIDARVQAGARLVPHGPVQAFGELMPSYCVGYATRGGVHHCWAWQRPVAAVGHVDYEVDHRAHFEFLEYVQREILGHSEPPPAVVAGLRAGLLRDIGAHAPMRERNGAAAASYAIYLRRGMALGWVTPEGRPTGDKGLRRQVWALDVVAEPVPAAPAPPVAQLADILSRLPPDQLAALLGGLQAPGAGQLRHPAAPEPAQEGASTAPPPEASPSPAGAPPEAPPAPPAPAAVAPPVAPAAPVQAPSAAPSKGRARGRAEADEEAEAPAAPAAPRPFPGRR